MNKANLIIRADVVWAQGIRGKGQVIAVVDTGIDGGQMDRIHPALQEALAEEPISYHLSGAWHDEVGHGTHVAGSAVGRAIRVPVPEQVALKISTREMEPSVVNSVASSSREDILGVAHEALLTFQAWSDEMRRYTHGQMGFLFLDAAHRKRHESPFSDEPSERPKKRDGAPLTGFDDLPLDKVIALADEIDRVPTPPTAAFPARVVNMSFSAEHGEYNDNSRWIDRYVWRYRDMVVVVSASNRGIFGDPPIGDFGQAKNCITAGASNNEVYGQDPDEMWPKSIKGPGVGGDRVKPDLVAPGAGILSARAAAVNKYEDLPPKYPEYGRASGTSCAAPIISGAAALVRQFYAEKKGLGSPPASLVKATLINGARRIGQKRQREHMLRMGHKEKLDWRDELTLKDKGTGWGAPDQGWGLIDLERSLFPAGGRINWFEGEQRALHTGDKVRYSFRVADGEMLKITLVWTDPPHPDHAERYSKDPIVVHHLALVVVGPDGSHFAGNRFDRFRTTSVPVEAQQIEETLDRFNNVQNVYIEKPEPGVYRVFVHAVSLPIRTIWSVDAGTLPIHTDPSQTYSLVVSAKGLEESEPAQEQRAPIRFTSLASAKGTEGDPFLHEVRAVLPEGPATLVVTPLPGWLAVTPVKPGVWKLHGTPPQAEDLELRVEIVTEQATVHQVLSLSIDVSFL